MGIPSVLEMRFDSKNLRFYLAMINFFGTLKRTYRDETKPVGESCVITMVQSQVFWVTVRNQESIFSKSKFYW